MAPLFSLLWQHLYSLPSVKLLQAKFDLQYFEKIKSLQKGLAMTEISSFHLVTLSTKNVV